MPSVLSGLQRDVASALPSRDYYDLVNRRQIFHRNTWLTQDPCRSRAGEPAVRLGARPAAD